MKPVRPHPTCCPYNNLACPSAPFRFVAQGKRLDPTSTLDFLVHQHAHHFLETIPRHHRFLPPLEVGILSCIPGMVLHDKVNLSVPHDKSQVCVGALVTNKPLFALESAVEDSSDAFKLVGVSCLG